MRPSTLIVPLSPESTPVGPCEVGRPMQRFWRTGGMLMAFTRPQLAQFVADQRPHFEQLLKEFVEITSVSADQNRQADLERCAELGLATVRAFGGRVEIHPSCSGRTAGRPRLSRICEG